MSRNHTVVYQIPSVTVQVAQAVFPQGTLVLQTCDSLGPLSANPAFADLDHNVGHPAAPARLALVLVLQAIEDLSDAQAADAVRGRLDWNSAVALPLDDPGFAASILRAFRTRLLDGSAELRLLERVLETIHAAGRLKARGRQRTASTHGLAAMRPISRLTMVAQTPRHALNDLAAVAPAWLLSCVCFWIEPECVSRVLCESGPALAHPCGDRYTWKEEDHDSHPGIIGLD